MARTARCPRCNTRNQVPKGAVGINCKKCGEQIRVKAEVLETSFQHSRGNFFDRLEQTFSQPKGIIIGSAVLLVLFGLFWGLLHWQMSKPAAPKPPVAQNQNQDQTDTSEPTPSTAPVAPAPPVAVVQAPQVVGPTSAPATTQAVVTRPIPRALPALVIPVSDAKIREAITRGVNYLIGQYDPATHMVNVTDVSQVNCVDALCVYALLQCNDAISDPRLNPTSPFMHAAIDAMKRCVMESEREIYGRSLRANALALVNQPADRAALDKDVVWLGRAARQGAYTYFMPTVPPNQAIGWDNSNSQYGVLGVWAGAEVGISVPSSYWEAVQKHWVDCQLPDGTFAYSQGQGGRLSMTVAGVASLCIAHDYLAASSATGVESRSAALARALGWLDSGDNAVKYDAGGPSHYLTYSLYGIARAGLASGYKYFGMHDWYAELARDPLATQGTDGSFGGNSIDTALTVLFLARGLHPVIFNKLNIDGVASNHLRDVANLSHYASRELEHTFNAQVVPLSHEWIDWTDSPVLYLAAATAPDISDHECDQIRDFVQAGGMLFTNADDGSAAFNKFADQLAQRLFPNYPFQALPLDHPLYSALFHLKPAPSLKAVSNGARLLMVHSSRDVARSWNTHDWSAVEPDYQLGINIFLYEAGTRDFRNRLDTNYVPAPKAAPIVTLPVARVQYAGNWDPEPYAWTRFSRQFQWKTSFALDVRPTDIKSLSPTATPVADLTGTDSQQFTGDEIVALRQYVQQGGVLLIDSCGGAAGFVSSQKTLLDAMLSGASVEPLDASHPLMIAGGDCMEKLPEAESRAGRTDIDAPGIITIGRGHVIVTPLDLTCGLLNTATLGINGYKPAYAESFVKNLLLWTWNGQHDR